MAGQDARTVYLYDTFACGIISGYFGGREINFSGDGVGEEFMLAVLTRRRNMLKIERFFNTSRNKPTRLPQRLYAIEKHKNLKNQQKPF